LYTCGQHIQEKAERISDIRLTECFDLVDQDVDLCSVKYLRFDGLKQSRYRVTWVWHRQCE